MPTVSLEQIVQHLKEIQKNLGEEPYRAAVKEMALTFVNDAKGEIFLKTFVTMLHADWLDLPALRKAPPAPVQMPSMADLIRQTVPSIRTQIQYDLYMLAFETLSKYMDSCYSNRPSEEVEALRSAFNQLLDRAVKVTHVVTQVGEVPQENAHDSWKDFVQPPAQFTEVEDQRRLLAELDTMETTSQLNAWYTAEKERLNKIVTKRYRDELYDAIRAKKNSLESN